MSSVLPVPSAGPDIDQRILMHGLRWTDFEVLLAVRGERSVPRVAFSGGTVELMSPSTHHERIKTLLARLLEAWAEENDIALDGYGSWTVKDPVHERGLEPDECYVVGRPPGERPDLAIEVVWTAGGLDKLAIYAGLGVPEVWRWADGALTAYVLRAGRYEAVERSELFPDLDLGALTSFLDREDQTAAVRAWRKQISS